MDTSREPLEPPLNPPEPRHWGSVEEWFDATEAIVEIEYMGLTLRCRMDHYALHIGLVRIQWLATQGRDAIEGRALCAYATSLGEPGDRIFEAIASGAEIGCNWDFADLLPPSEVAAIWECAIETARKSGQWRE